MQLLRREIELLFQTDLPVLVRGETATGKGFVAELLHRQSRVPGKFLRVDCLSHAELTSTLFEAIEKADPQTELAQLMTSGGTLVLDGVEELSLASQGMLLLVLKREAPVFTDSAATMRIVSTSSIDLHELTEQKRFRTDLLYHLNAVKLNLLPLRQRPEDIRGLVDFYLERHSWEARRSRPFLSSELQDLLEAYPWPGNLRQLDNLIRSFVTMGSEEVIRRELMTRGVEPRRNWDLDQIDLSRPLALKEITRQMTHDVERQIILKVLQANGWNRQKTATWLQISYRSLLYKLSDISDEQPSRVRSLMSRKLGVANY